MASLVALLDRPDSRSLGIIPPVTSENEKITVFGLSPLSRKRADHLTKQEINDLLAAKHALPVKGELDEQFDHETTSALWIGDDFRELAASLNLPIPQLPSTTMQANGGEFVVQGTQVSFEYIELWIDRAFAIFKEADVASRAEIAKLLKWTLPGNKKVSAASLVASNSMEKELDWQLRTIAKGEDKKLWEQELRNLLDQARDPFEGVQLYVVIGGSSSGRENFASRFSAAKGIAYESFKKHFVEDLKDTNKWALMEYGQKIVEKEPLHLVLKVLKSVRGVSGKLVIDSVRHEEILDTLKWISASGTLHSIGIDSDPELQRKAVWEKGLNADDVFKHPTENQIENLVAKADYHVDPNKLTEKELRDIVD